MIYPCLWRENDLQDPIEVCRIDRGFEGWSNPDQIQMKICIQIAQL